MVVVVVVVVVFVFFEFCSPLFEGVSIVAVAVLSSTNATIGGTVIMVTTSLSSTFGASVAARSVVLGG